MLFVINVVIVVIIIIIITIIANIIIIITVILILSMVTAHLEKCQNWTRFWHSRSLSLLGSLHTINQIKNEKKIGKIEHLYSFFSAGSLFEKLLKSASSP